MKYMGSKKSMLKNGLGDVLTKEASSAKRFVDLFCGSGSVSWYAATELNVPVLACDLQNFATVLAGTVIKRTKPIPKEKVLASWLSQAIKIRSQFKEWRYAFGLDQSNSRSRGDTHIISKWHRSAQEMCSDQGVFKDLLIYKSYGGHYFSPTQALTLDAMLMALPKEPNLRELCLATTIVVASRCAAAPGHTAQPFKATETASKFLYDAWAREPTKEAENIVGSLCQLHASPRHRGRTKVGDANSIARTLTSGDVVFIDPPYSGVQYSRFYHVLETIARGQCGEVVGVGRYPPFEERPNSPYSKRGTSFDAISDLLQALSQRGCKVVLTFPLAQCSNGLSGEGIQRISEDLFWVKRKKIRSKFSTLGGNTRIRDARKLSDELILVLDSK